MHGCELGVSLRCKRQLEQIGKEKFFGHEKARNRETLNTYRYSNPSPDTSSSTEKPYVFQQINLDKKSEEKPCPTEKKQVETNQSHSRKKKPAETDESPSQTKKAVENSQSHSPVVKKKPHRYPYGTSLIEIIVDIYYDTVKDSSLNPEFRIQPRSLFPLHWPIFISLQPCWKVPHSHVGAFPIIHHPILDKLTKDQKAAIIHSLLLRKLSEVDYTLFSTVLSTLGLLDSYNSMMGYRVIRRAVQNGVIGGVATSVGELKGLKTSASFALHHEHIFVVKIRSDCGVCQQPFSSDELKQILRELAVGIYIHDTFPFFSLHFNEEGCLYPVIHPAYCNTLVGEVIGFLDYFMKGFLNGGVYERNFLKNWHTSGNMDKEFLKSHLIDLQCYCRVHLFNSGYVSLREKMAMEGLEGPERNMSDSPDSTFQTKFTTSFRIISKVHNVREQDGVFLIEPDFDVEYTIDLMPDYKEFIQTFKRENGSYPESFTVLQGVYESMKDEIKTLMPKMPIFKEYFQMLSVITFCAYYLKSLKMVGRIPNFKEVPVVHSFAFPKVLPPVPVRFYTFHKINLTLKSFIQECRTEESKSSFCGLKLDKILKDFTQQTFPEPSLNVRNQIQSTVEHFISKAVPAEVVSMGIDKNLIKKNSRAVTQHLIQLAMAYRQELKRIANELFTSVPSLGSIDEFEKQPNFEHQIMFLKGHIRHFESIQSSLAEPALPNEMLQSILQVKEETVKELTQKIHESINNQAQKAKRDLQNAIETLKSNGQECSQAIAKLNRDLLDIPTSDWQLCATIRSHLQQQPNYCSIDVDATVEHNLSGVRQQTQRARIEIKNNIDHLNGVHRQIQDEQRELQLKLHNLPAETAAAEQESIENMIADVKKQTIEIIKKEFTDWIVQVNKVIDDYSSKQERLSDTLFNDPASDISLLMSYPHSTLTIADGGYYHDLGDNFRIVGGCSVQLSSLELQPIWQSDQSLVNTACICAEKLEPEIFSSDTLEHGGNKYTVFKVQTISMNNVINSMQQLILSLKSNSCKIKVAADISIWTKLLCNIGADHVQIQRDLGTVCLQNGRTALDQLVESCDAETCKFVIQLAPTSTSMPTEKGILPLHTAASSGNIEVVKVLLSEVPNLINSCTNSGETPLMAASARGHNETVKLLLGSSANVNHRLPCGLSALWMSLHNGHEETSITLINWTESNLMVLQNNGENLLHEAVKQSLCKAAVTLVHRGVQLLQPRKSDGKTPWHLAAELGQVTVLQAMLQSGRITDINVTVEELYSSPCMSDKIGTSALHFAAAKGKSDVVLLLIEAKASPDLRNKQGSSPLVIAMENGFEEVALILAEKTCGSSYDLICAAQRRMFKVCDVFVRKGVALESHDNLDYPYYLLINGEYSRYRCLAEGGKIDCKKKYNGATSLSVAAEYGHATLTNYLSQKGSTYESPTKRDLLHWLVIADDIGFLRKWLSEHSIIDGNIRNGFEKGKTLFYVAAEHASFRCLMLLKKSVPSAMVTDAWNGKHILDAAIRSKNAKVLEILLPLVGDLNQTINPDGYNAMTLAAEIGSIDLIKQIPSWGGNILTEDSQNRTCMQIAIFHNDMKMLHAISEAESPSLWPKDIWMTANAGGCKEKIISWLFNQLGAEQKIINKEKCFIALHDATNSGDGNTVQAILQLMKQNDIIGFACSTAMKGNTALALATRNTQYRIIENLLAYGAKADFPPTKECALFAACDLNNIELLRTFYSKQAYKVPIDNELMKILQHFTKSIYIKEALSGCFVQYDTDKDLLLCAIQNEKLKDYRQILMKEFPINCTYIKIDGSEFFLPFALILFPTLKAFLELSTDKLRIDNLDKNGRSLAFFLISLPDCIENVLLYLKKRFRNQFASLLKLQDKSLIITAASQKSIKKLLNLMNSAECPLETRYGPDGWTLLHLTVYAQNPSAVSHFFNTFKDYSVDIQDRNGITPLMMASSIGNEFILRELMEKGANPNITDRKGRNAFHHALRSKVVTTSMLLMSKMHDLSVKDRSGKTYLMYAVLSSMHTIIRSLIAQGVDVHSVDNQKGFSALHYAAAVGDAESIDILLKNQKKFNSIMPNGTKVTPSEVTPLHLASRQGHVDACMKLLKFGASLETTYTEGITAANLCFSPKCPEIIQLFQRTSSFHYPGQDLQMIKCCCMTDNSENLRFLIGLNVNVNAVDKNGMNALHFAAIYDAPLCTTILLATNCSPNVLDSISLSTPLHMAAARGHVVIIQQLLSYGAHPHMYDKEGNTPLLKAIAEGHCGAVVELLQQNVNCMQPSRTGLSPSVASFMQHNEKITQIVTVISKELPSKSDIENIPRFAFRKMNLQMPLLEFMREQWKVSIQAGDTFLHLAVRMVAIEALHLLLILEPELIHIKNKLGKTALSIAQNIAADNPEPLAALRRHHFPKVMPNDNFDVNNWLVTDSKLHKAGDSDSLPLNSWIDHVEERGNCEANLSFCSADAQRAFALNNVQKWFSLAQQTEAKQFLELLSPAAVQKWLSSIQSLSIHEYSTYVTSWLCWCKEYLCDVSCCTRLARLFLDHYPWHLLHSTAEWHKVASSIKHLSNSNGTTLLLWAEEYFKPTFIFEVDALKWKSCCQIWIDFFELTKNDATLLCIPPLSEALSFTAGSDYLTRCIQCLRKIPSVEHRKIQLLLLDDLPPHKVIDCIQKKGYTGPIANHLLTRGCIFESKAIPSMNATSDLQSFTTQVLVYTIYQRPSAFQPLLNFLKKLQSQCGLREDEKIIISSIICSGLEAKVESWKSLSAWLALSQRLRDEYGIEALQKLVQHKATNVQQPIEMFTTTIQLMLELHHYFTNNILQGKQNTCISATVILSKYSSLDQLVACLQNLLKHDYEKRFPEKPIMELKKQFSAKSPYIYLALPEIELSGLLTEYEYILKVSEHYFGKSIDMLGKEAQQLGRQLLHNRENELHIFSIIRQSIRLHFGIYPNNTQIITAMAILNTQHNQKGRIAQVRTGEGKSMITTIIATFLALHGRIVDIITANHYLAVRDKKKFCDYYQHFGISCSHICHRPLKSDHFDAQVLFGTNTDFEFSIMFDAIQDTRLRFVCIKGVKSRRNFDAVIVDEVDNLFIDTALSSARISNPSSKDVSWVYEPLWFALQENPFLFLISVQYLRMVLKNYQNGRFSYQVEYFSDEMLLTWRNSALIASKKKLDHDYIIRSSEDDDKKLKIIIVDPDNTGRLMIGSRWSNGVHEFVEVMNHLQPETESNTAAALCHPAFFSLYRNIYGLTGTMGEDIERNEVADIYNVTSFDVPPHKLCIRIEEPCKILCSHDEHIKALVSEILKKQTARRPVLVLFPSISQSALFSNVLKEKKVMHFVLNEKQKEDEEFIIAKAGEAGQVILATNMAGRGTDIILSSESYDAGGLHVIFSFFPVNLRVEEQGYGRAGRQGQPGTCNMILSLNDPLICSLITSQKQREQLLVNPNFIQCLREKRRDYVSSESEKRKLASQRELILFNHVIKEFFDVLSKIRMQMESVGFLLIIKAIQTEKHDNSRKWLYDPLHPKFAYVLAQVANVKKALKGSIHNSELQSFQKSYTELLIEEWSLFFTKLEKQLHSTQWNLLSWEAEVKKSFGDFMSSKLSQTIADPVADFCDWLATLSSATLP